jgi:predicted HTH transcriptional regulator
MLGFFLFKTLHLVSLKRRALRAKVLGKLKIAKQLGCGVSTVQRVIRAAA